MQQLNSAAPDLAFGNESSCRFKSNMAPHNKPQREMNLLERPKIRIFLADDHAFLREGVRSCLSMQKMFEIVGEASDGQEAIEKCQKLRPDVVIMDISMPVMDGVEAARYLRRCLPAVKVLMFSIHENEEHVTQSIDAGARGYLVKSCTPAELISAIETLYAGETFFSSRITELYIKSCLGFPGKVQSAACHDLSIRERQVLTLIAEGLSSKQAASSLGISVRTIEKHRERIMGKLKLHSVVELTKYAISKQMIKVQ
jgi:DNA-binding NarL/FixJ family response regulator